MKLSRPVLSWALYDWANSGFATAVLAGFFPLFFKEYWSTGVAAGESTFRLGVANSLASLLVVVMAPVLGAIADQGSARKRFLLLFTALGIVMAGGLYLVGEGHWQLAVILYVIAQVGFSGGNIFYDSLLVNVTDTGGFHRVSALGFALGYLGGGLIFGFNVYMSLHPEAFGLASPGAAVQLAFVIVALWWALFSIPLFLWVEEPRIHAPTSRLAAVRNGFVQLRATFAHLRRLRVVFIFLAGYWLYIDGVDTIVRMAVDYGLSIGFNANDLILALLLTQFVGFPAAIAFGRIGDWLGAKSGIFIALAVYAVVTVWAYFMNDRWEFYAVAICIGLVQGGVQSLSRSLFAHIIPPDKSAEFFGFYNMLGKFAAVLGPIMVGIVSMVSGSPRYSILSILILFAAGALLLAKVNVAEGREMAQRL